MLSSNSSRNPFILPNFNDSDSELDTVTNEDFEVFYNDIHQSLNEESKFQRNNRRRFIMQSQERSKKKLTNIYRERLQNLAQIHEKQINDLKEEWNKARCQAYLDDVSAEVQDQKTTQILSLCGKYSEASKIQQNSNKRKNSERCNKKFLNLLSIMQHRHQCEIDALVSSFHSEMSLSNSEHEILKEQIENQYKTDIIQNSTEMINIIADSDSPVPMKQRLIRTVSPQKNKKVSPNMRNANHAMTPIPKYQFKC